MIGVSTLESLSAESLRSLVIAFRDTVHAHAEEINRLNVYPVPDGDTGTNMARTLDAVVAELDAAPGGLDATCDAISHGSLMGARGNSGVILSQLLRGMSSTLKTRARTTGAATAATAASVAEALKASAASAYQAVLRPIEGTILTVAREAADAAHQAADDGATLAEVLRAGRAAGRAALDRTPEQLPVLRDAGVVDAGGAGFMLLFDAALHIVDGEPLPTPVGGPAAVALPTAGTGGSPGVADLRYEVMFLLHLTDDRIEDFRRRWGRIGDSIVVVGGDGLWNCHVHTDDIGAAIEAALDVGGRPARIRVTDLREEAEATAAQHDDLARMSLGDDPPAAPSASTRERVTCAVVAVASGDGLAELFGRLGVQQVVRGGQTLNPSTAELLAAVQATVADEVIVLPNNGNIVPVAEQVAGLGDLSDRRIVVVPTRSMPEALAALVCYDADADAATNAAAMSAAAAATSTGELTRAVRDSRSDAGPVVAGDWIGVSRSTGRNEGIVAVGADPVGTARALVDHLVAGRPDAGLLTIVVGEQAESGVTDSLLAAVAHGHAALEVEVHHGGQPLYPYLFGLE